MLLGQMVLFLWLAVSVGRGHEVGPYAYLGRKRMMGDVAHSTHMAPSVFV